MWFKCVYFEVRVKHFPALSHLLVLLHKCYPRSKGISWSTMLFSPVTLTWYCTPPTIRAHWNQTPVRWRASFQLSQVAVATYRWNSIDIVSWTSYRNLSWLSHPHSSSWRNSLPQDNIARYAGHVTSLAQSSVFNVKLVVIAAKNVNSRTPRSIACIAKINDSIIQRVSPSYKNMYFHRAAGLTIKTKEFIFLWYCDSHNYDPECRCS